MPLVRRVVENAYRAVAVSHGLLALCEKSFATSNLDCIPNGVDVEVFRPDPEKQPVAEPDAEGRLRPVRVVFAGRFSPQKRLNRLVEAAGILKDRGVMGFSVDLYGGGPTESEVKALTARAGLERIVRFPGWISREELGKVLGRSDLFVLPSDKEGMPIACLQAMAAGMTVVGSRTLGIEEVVEEEKTGLLVGVGDVNGLADALERLITHRDELARMGREGRALAYERFRWDVIVDRYLAILSGAARARRSLEE
jgi:1,4-alpha-glucan branching enzyme